MLVPGYVDATEVGRGGFSTVYSARSEATGETVALKVFTSSDVDGRRVRRECAALERLDGIAGVVPVLGVTTTSESSPVIVMRYYPMTMATMVAEGGVTPEVAVGWLGEIATALDQASLLGVSHRDVKPANVLLDEAGRAHLADFGISALGELENGTTTAMAFSPPYAAPERLEGRADVDPVLGDIYSLAATTWAAMAGGAPFGTSTTGGVSGLVSRVMASELDRPTQMPSALYDVLRTGMSLRPEDRYPSGSAMADAARRALESPDDVTVARLATGAAPLVAAPPLVNGLRSTGDAGGASHQEESDQFGSDRAAEDHFDGDDALPTVSHNTKKIAAIAAGLLLLIVGAALAMVIRTDPDVVVASRASDERTETTKTREAAGPAPTVADATLEPPTDTIAFPDPLIVENTTPTIDPGNADTGNPGGSVPGRTPQTSNPGNGAVTSPVTAPQSAPATAPQATPAPPPATPTSCQLTNGNVALSPGIRVFEMSAQKATLTAKVNCQLSRGGPLSGSLLLFGEFPSLGFQGGTSIVSGSITWADGQSTQASGAVVVTPGPPDDGVDNYNVDFNLTFPGGFGAPGSTKFILLADAVSDPDAGRVIAISNMSGPFTWKR